MTLLSDGAHPESQAAPDAPSGPVRKWLPWAVLVVAAGLALVFGLRSHSAKPTLDSQVGHIASELKCPVCDGETVAESQSAPSVEIRTEIRQDLIKGESEQQIIAGFEASYGAGILEKPPASGVGLVVWLLPLLGVLLAGTGLGLALRRWRKAAPPASSDPSSAGVASSAAGGGPLPAGTGPLPAGGGLETELVASEPVASEPVAVSASEGSGVEGKRPRRLSKALVAGAGAVIIAAGAAWALIGSTGHRLPGEEITGQALGTEQVNADLLAAQNDEQKNPPDVADAVKEYQAVLNSAPNQVEALTGQGWLLTGTGEPALVQQGLSELQKAESVDATYGPAHLYRGLALLGEGDYQNSVAELQWYLNNSPDATLVPSVRKALAQAQAGAKTEAPPG